MERTVLYHVTFVANPRKRTLHVHNHERTIATVKAVPPTGIVGHYDRHGDCMWIPDFDAIREALPHIHRKAYDKATMWWFPKDMHSDISAFRDPKNAASKTLYDSKGRLIGTLYATPYLYSRGTTEG